MEVLFEILAGRDDEADVESKYAPLSYSAAKM